MERDIRRHKLTTMILLTLFIIMFIVTMLTRLLLEILRANDIMIDQLIMDRYSFFAITITLGALIIAAFYITVNKLVVSRIRTLNKAVEEVVKGNLDISVEVKGFDELTILTSSFNKMTSELKANEYLSKEFVRNVSHEFKTPISAIRGFAELIEAETDSSSLKEYANIITAESDRLASMSSSILQLSLLDSSTMIKNNDTFSPSEQIRSVLRLLHSKCENKNIELDFQMQEFVITSNELLLNQVWLNLIGNAIKYSNNDGKITIVTGSDSDRSYVEIIDNGIGIKDEDKDKIFNQFFMSDKSRSSGGSGLGLSITKKILEKLDGTIHFESTFGVGTKFVVTLPNK